MERRGGAVTGVYSYGNALVARNGEVVLSDGLGTTRATVNGVQAITSTLTTEAFGNAVAQWGSSANPYRFAGAWGYRDDGDAGLLHVGARYYDPQVGRFISRDAVLSEHPYLYCEDEPVNRVDPNGRVYVDINVSFTTIVLVHTIPVPFTFGGGFQYGNTRPGGGLSWHPYLFFGFGLPPGLGWGFNSSWDYITPGPFIGYGAYIPKRFWLPGLPAPGFQRGWSPGGGAFREVGIGSPGVSVVFGWVM